MPVSCHPLFQNKENLCNLKLRLMSEFVVQFIPGSVSPRPISRKSVRDTCYFFILGCNTWWTMWFDTDNATGCGDDETLQRIQMKHPGMVCNHPLAIETKVVDAGGQCLKYVTLQLFFALG